MFWKKTKAEQIKDKIVNKKINVEEKDWTYTFRIDSKVSVQFTPKNEEEMILALPKVEETIEKASKSKK